MCSGCGPGDCRCEPCECRIQSDVRFMCCDSIRGACIVQPFGRNRPNIHHRTPLHRSRPLPTRYPSAPSAVGTPSLRLCSHAASLDADSASLTFRSRCSCCSCSLYSGSKGWCAAGLPPAPPSSSPLRLPATSAGPRACSTGVADPARAARPRTRQQPHTAGNTLCAQPAPLTGSLIAGAALETPEPPL